ncbi:MAG: hypothetical protein IPH53_02120 [Flavobacteriales bacterium]|nr:hypothetical protein [Flavobacteriales bacterium]
MERERLTRLLDEPGRVASEDLVGLRALTERYPWFSGAHLLLAVGEHAAGDVLFDDRLRTTAANVPSRAVVYDLVQPTDGPAPTRRATPPDAGPMRLPSVATERPLDFEDHTPEPAWAAPPIAVEPPVAPPQARIEVPPAAEPPEAPADPLDRQIQEAAYARVYDLTWRERIPPAPVAEAPLAAVPPSDPITEAPARPSPQLDPSSRFRFSEWLDLSSSEPATNAPVAQIHVAADWIRTPAEERDRASRMTMHGEASPADVQGLIDRFIQGQTPAPARKVEFFTPQQAAKRSLEDHADLVTETLARIYEQQGNLAKAAQAYRKLALRTPERSAEFIARAMALEGRQDR